MTPEAAGLALKSSWPKKKNKKRGERLHEKKGKRKTN